ncbi:MAG: hypothetical protein IJW63_02690 [Lachnospiraceae bacterium]|nr:hypothetical protein [Lachnospiraceae bacterium]
MVWKNPFLAKNTEQQSDFLTLFESAVLQMIEDKNFSGVSYVSSTPGAGKTSLFRAFSNDILGRTAEKEQKEDNKEYFDYMKKLGVIRNDKILLFSGYLSCARSYSIIEEMFQNGRRKQVFFALLNYRIAISFMRGIEKVFDWSLEDYEKVTFLNLPEEMEAESEYFKNGRTVYDWACNGERELCRYLDSDRSERIALSFIHTTLLILKLFEPSNILINEEQYFEKSLMIFDDFHKLAENQRRYMSEAVLTLKTNTGVWFGQRLEGVESAQVISMDGSLDRDYHLNIVIDNYWAEKYAAFYSMIGRIADRRVKEAQINALSNFSDCISEEIDLKAYTKNLKKFCADIYAYLVNNFETKLKYSEILSYLKENEQMNAMEKAVWYECIMIMERREQSGQLSFFLGEIKSLESFRNFVSLNEKGARFYVCHKCKIPFYYGISNLQILSSCNVQQFLVFAGAYFDSCRIKSLGNYKRRKKIALSPEEQMETISNIVKQRWDDMDFRYSNIETIKLFLNNIGKLGQDARDLGKNSYEGGAYTGIAINKQELKQNLHNPEYQLLIEVLGACISSRYLERREGKKSGEITLYLNRWLCVYYELPLAYGGFKRCTLNKLLKMCQQTDVVEDGQLELSLGGRE